MVQDINDVCMNTIRQAQHDTNSASWHDKLLHLIFSTFDTLHQTSILYLCVYWKTKTICDELFVVRYIQFTSQKLFTVTYC